MGRRHMTEAHRLRLWSSANEQAVPAAAAAAASSSSSATATPSRKLSRPRSSGGWNCETCTALNTFFSDTCSICFHSRYSKQRKKMKLSHPPPDDASKKDAEEEADDDDAMDTDNEETDSVENNWTCQTCTLINTDVKLNECSACGTARPATKPKKPGRPSKPPRVSISSPPPSTPPKANHVTTPPSSSSNSRPTRTQHSKLKELRYKLCPCCLAPATINATRCREDNCGYNFREKWMDEESSGRCLDGVFVPFPPYQRPIKTFIEYDFRSQFSVDDPPRPPRPSCPSGVAARLSVFQCDCCERYIPFMHRYHHCLTCDQRFDSELARVWGSKDFCADCYASSRSLDKHEHHHEWVERVADEEAMDANWEPNFFSDDEEEDEDEEEEEEEEEETKEPCRENKPELQPTPRRPRITCVINRRPKYDSPNPPPLPSISANAVTHPQDDSRGDKETESSANAPLSVHPPPQPSVVPFPSFEQFAATTRVFPRPTPYGQPRPLRTGVDKDQDAEGRHILEEQRLLREEYRRLSALQARHDEQQRMKPAVLPTRATPLLSLAASSTNSLQPATIAATTTAAAAASSTTASLISPNNSRDRPSVPMLDVPKHVSDRASPTNDSFLSSTIGFHLKPVVDDAKLLREASQTIDELQAKIAKQEARYQDLHRTLTTATKLNMTLDETVNQLKKEKEILKAAQSKLKEKINQHHKHEVNYKAEISRLTTRLSAATQPKPTAPPATTASSDGPLASECVICCDRRRDVVFQPCGHLLTCHTCAGPNAIHQHSSLERYHQCSECTTPIKKRIVIKF